MNSTQRVRSITLSALLACVLAGCSSGGTRHGTAPIGHTLGPFTSPSPTYPQEASFLYTGDAEVDYVQWQEDSTGSLQGTELDAKTTGSVPNAQVSVQQVSFTGQLSGNTVTVVAIGGSAHGTLGGNTLTVNNIAADGSIQPETLRRASDADYNTALGALRAAVQKANAQQDSANAQSAAEQTLARDYQNLDDAKATLSSDASSMNNDVTGIETDAASAHADELNVLHEANGPDTTGVCGDASGVSGDASGVSGDASGISSDLDGITTDLATLHDHASTVASDLQALLAIEPKYAGGAGPSPLDVHRALANASLAAGNNVTYANGYADRANAAVTAAYGYAASASQAGGCGSTDGPPSPLSHISSPFDGNGAVSA